MEDWKSPIGFDEWDKAVARTPLSRFKGTGGVCTGVQSMAMARNEASSFGVDRDRTERVKSDGD